MSGGPGPARAARVVYAAIVVAALAVTAVLGVLRANVAATLPAPPVPPMILRAGIVVLLMGATVALRLLRATLPPAGGEPDAWWAANLGRAVALWALMDGAAIAGAVVFLLSGDVLALVLAVSWALAMFVACAPGRLTA